MTAEVAPPVVLRRAGPAAQGDAAPRARRRGQRHRRRRRARPHERAGGGKHPARRRHRADPANHLPRQEPHRLQSELMGAAALGIHNMMVLTGDDPKAGDQPDTKPVFDIDSKTLLETARRLRDEGKLPTGREVAGKAAFFLGAADLPIDPPAGLAAEFAARESRRRRPVRADPVLHGCGTDAPLCRRAGEGRAHPAARHPDRHQSAAFGQVGAMDEEPSVRHHHPRRVHRAHGKGRRSRLAKACASASI